jgi:energy-converting hydrogenase B subunit D
VTALQIIALVLVALGGAAVVLTPEPLRQTMVLGIYGIALTLLFFVFQAPDVALSEIVVTGIGLPLIVLAALRKIHQQEDEHRAKAGERGGQE